MMSAASGIPLPPSTRSGLAKKENKRGFQREDRTPTNTNHVLTLKLTVYIYKVIMAKSNSSSSSSNNNNNNNKNKNNNNNNKGLVDHSGRKWSRRINGNYFCSVENALMEFFRALQSLRPTQRPTCGLPGT